MRVRQTLAWLLFLVLAGTAALVPVQARADEGCYVSIKQTPSGPQGELICPGRDGRGGDPTDPTDPGDGMCNRAGEVIPCVSEQGVWYDPGFCWLSFSFVYGPESGMLPELFAQHGNTGVIVMCYIGPRASPTYVWFADAAPPPDPGEMAVRAVAQMNLHAPAIGIVPEASPGSVGIVGLPVWMWVADPGPSVSGPNARSISERGYTVTLTARVTKYVWNMGDGGSVTCTTPGTPYSDARGLAASPDCGYRYVSDGNHPVSVTSYWQVDWSGIGRTGTLNYSFTNNTAITIGEVQVVRLR